MYVLTGRNSGRHAAKGFPGRGVTVAFHGCSLGLLWLIRHQSPKLFRGDTQRDCDALQRSTLNPLVPVFESHDGVVMDARGIRQILLCQVFPKAQLPHHITNVPLEFHNGEQ